MTPKYNLLLRRDEFAEDAGVTQQVPFSIMVFLLMNRVVGESGGVEWSGGEWSGGRQVRVGGYTHASTPGHTLKGLSDVIDVWQNLLVLMLMLLPTPPNCVRRWRLYCTSPFRGDGWRTR